MKMAKILMKGNEAIAESALRAGCTHYFGYPITPQTELSEYLAMEMPKRKDCFFMQAESEIAAINMVLGASSAGARVMTSSSGPGISLKQEGISYIAACNLPCVIVNMARGGPGLGNIAPSQADYFQAVKGGGHGDYRLIVLAPNSVQELADLTVDAFDLADKYRNPVMILGDGLLGQMMESVEFKKSSKNDVSAKPWATRGAKGRKPNIINSLYLDPKELEQVNLKLQEKYREIEKKEKRCEFYKMEDAEFAIVAFGIMSRIAKSVVNEARAKGIKAGLIRPISLWPFPSEKIAGAAEKTKAFLVTELNAGQMVEDVRLAVNGKKPVHFIGRLGGMLLTPQQLMEKLLEVAK
jgi:2-oxoglutarate ferredoxin oxidoreductase subunit alpha